MLRRRRRLQTIIITGYMQAFFLFIFGGSREGGVSFSKQAAGGRLVQGPFGGGRKGGGQVRWLGVVPIELGANGVVAGPVGGGREGGC